MKHTHMRTFMRLPLMVLLASLALWGLAAQGSVQNLPADVAARLETEGFKHQVGNGQLELFCNEDTGFIAVWSVNEQKLWYSSPLAWEDDPRAAGANRMALASALAIRKADDLGTIQPINSLINVVRRNGLSIEPIDGGIRMTFDFSRDEFVIPVEYLLQDDTLLVRIPLKEVKEPSYFNKIRAEERAAASEAAALEAAENPPEEGEEAFEEEEVEEVKDNKDILNRITLLPYLGSQYEGTEGFLMVPDGSGALIRFNNKRSSESLELPVYGTDPAIDIQMKRDIKQKVTLPVFGLSTADGAFMGIIEDGAARTLINAETSGQKSSYNSVSATYVFRDLDVVSVAERVGTNRDIRLFDTRLPDDEYFAVRYVFLGKGQTSYADMAQRLQTYLAQAGRLRKSPASTGNPFFMSFFGGGQQVKPVLGIPMEVTTAYTTFEDAQAILAKLKEAGVTDLVANFTSWVSGGDEKDYPDKANAEGGLGGDWGLRKLSDWSKEQGIKLFVETDLVRLYRSSIWFMKELVAARRIFKSPLEVYYYKSSTYDKDSRYAPVTLIRPIEVVKAVERFLNNFRQFPDIGVALSSIGNTTYSDFDEKEGTGRGKVASIFADTLKTVAAQRPVLLDAPMGYSLLAPDYVTSLPSVSSRYDMVDQSIPFMQMVLRGYVPYALEAGNTATNLRDWTLRCLEYGAQPYFDVLARNAKNLVETRFRRLFDRDVNSWLPDIISAGKEIQKVLDTVKGQPIVKHQIVSSRVRITTYGNGISIAVNYGTKPVQLEGNIAVPARAYTVFRGSN